MKVQSPGSFKGKISIFVIFGICIFLLAQFIHPEIDNPPVTGDLQAPPEVKAIIQRSCYNCHSNESKLSWYDKIVPVYWKVADHIRDGRNLLNFSELDRFSEGDQNAKLWESVNQIIFGSMPLSEYTLVHRDAKISEDEIRLLKKWLENKTVVQPTDSAKGMSLADQYLLLRLGDTITQKPRALNGIQFMPDYKHWGLVTVTDRYDNGTLRAILGNKTAIKAIGENKTNPWPDGTTFAKVAWSAIKDAAGNLQAGPFIQVEYMIKDKQKYASTKGWGFARFKTPKLVSYGKDSLFASECVNCHRPMKENDFVFTKPVVSLPLNVHEVRNIAVNKMNNSMSVVYGGKNTESAYRIQWKQKEDDHWFGARLPGECLQMDSLQDFESAIPFF